MDMFKLGNDNGLVEYVEGKLDRKHAAILEDRMRADPRLAAEVDELRRLTARLRESALGESAPERRLPNARPSVWPRVEALIQPRRSTAFTAGPRFALGA